MQRGPFLIQSCDDDCSFSVYKYLSSSRDQEHHVSVGNLIQPIESLDVLGLFSYHRFSSNAPTATTSSYTTAIPLLSSSSRFHYQCDWWIRDRCQHISYPYQLSIIVAQGFHGLAHLSPSRDSAPPPHSHQIPPSTKRNQDQRGVKDNKFSRQSPRRFSCPLTLLQRHAQFIPIRIYFAPTYLHISNQ
jgi:hypothetical protein